MDMFSLMFAVFSAILCLRMSESYKFDNKVWCYRCVSTHPGCGDVFDWRWYWSYTCPGKDDKCVKIVEKKGSTEIITRDCLSHLEGYRRDIPSDRYEGCRPAAKDVKLGHYTFPEIKELDIKRDYFDSATYCFCDFDYFCNAATSTTSIRWTTAVATALAALIVGRLWLPNVD